MSDEMKPQESDFNRRAGDDTTYRLQAADRVRAIRGLLGKCAATGPLADVGSFTGFAAQEYAAAVGGQAVCFDFAEAALAACREKGLEARRWDVAAEPCPAEDGEFRTVIAAEIIEHLDDTDRFIGELQRILQPGGLLVVTTPNLAYWLNRLRLLAGRVPWSYPGVSRTARDSVTVDLNHLRVSTAGEWLALFRAHGLHLAARASYSLPLPRPGGFWPSLRLMLDGVLSIFPGLAFGMVFGLRKPAG
ncbi:MAG: class I SAM-dependent methyltransferase [Planctomycetota bacterium]|jgi:SAM-dependent methyltransferase